MEGGGWLGDRAGAQDHARSLHAFYGWAVHLRLVEFESRRLARGAGHRPSAAALSWGVKVLLLFPRADLALFIYDADAAYSGILLKFTDLERSDDGSSVRLEPQPVRQQLLDIGKEASYMNSSGRRASVTRSAPSAAR